MATVQGKLKVVARLINPTGVWEEEIPCELPDASYARSATHQLLATIRATGYLLREISATETQAILLSRVEDINITVEVSAVGLATNADLASATSRIKL